MNEKLLELKKEAKQRLEICRAKMDHHIDELNRQIDKFCDEALLIEKYEKMIKEDGSN